MHFYRGHSFIINRNDYGDLEQVSAYFCRNYDIYLTRSSDLFDTEEEAKRRLSCGNGYNQAIVKYVLTCKNIRDYIRDITAIKAYSINYYKSGINREPVLLGTKVL